MLLPLDLAILAWKESYVSPELAIGWRIGRYAHEFFDGLEQVRIAAIGHDSTIAALQRQARYPEPGLVTKPLGSRPWDMLFYHEPTATALKVVCIRNQIFPAQALRSLEECLKSGNLDVRLHYQVGVNAMVQNIINADIMRLCSLTQIRCRRLITTEGHSMSACPWCRQAGSAIRLDLDGRICCPECAGLEPSWHSLASGEV